VLLSASEWFRARRHYSRNTRSASHKDTLAALSDKQIKALIKMQAFSRGHSSRKSLTRLSIGSTTSSRESTQDSLLNEASLDLPIQKSFLKDYVDKLKADLASKSKDNDKLRASLNSQPSSAPATEARTSGKARTGFRGTRLLARLSSARPA
jgi:hypothetical protein